MVHSRQYILRLEGVRGPGLSCMGSWETSVDAQFLSFPRTEIFHLVAGAGKSVLWYVEL